MLLGRAIGAHQAENPVGVVGVRRPDLLAGDDEIIAVAFGAGLQRGEVRSGVRLGIALAPADQARGDLRQMLLLLRLGAVFQQRRPEHPDAERLDSGGRAPIAAISSRSDLGCSARSRPPPPYSFGQSRHGPALVAHPLEPDALRLGREFGVAAAPEGVAFRGHGLAHFRRAIGLEPGAGFTAELIEIGHGAFPYWRVENDLSRRIAEFNISLRRAMRGIAVVTRRDRVYRRGAQRLKNKRKPTCG